MPGSLAIAAVIPTHGARSLLLECLSALESTDLPVQRVVVVDDASNDGTTAAVKSRFPAVQLLVNERRCGFSASANRGLREVANADVVLLLNDDTRIDPGAVAALQQAFAADSRLGIGGSSLRFPNGKPQWSCGSRPTLGWLFALASGIPRLLERFPHYRQRHPVVPCNPEGGPVPVDWVTGAALAVRRRVLDEIGCLDEGYAFYCQDLDLCLRAQERGWRVCLLPDVSVIHHQGATIGRSADSIDRKQRPDLLWTDLLRWSRLNHGAAWVVAARTALAAGACTRLLARQLQRPFVAAERRRTWQQEGRALRKALRACLR